MLQLCILLVKTAYPTTPSGISISHSNHHSFQTQSKARVSSFDRVNGFWPGRPGQFFFLKSKRCRFRKKQKSTGCNRVFYWVLLSQPGHRVNPPGRRGSEATHRVGPGFKAMLTIEKEGKGVHQASHIHSMFHMVEIKINIVPKQNKTNIVQGHHIMHNVLHNLLLLHGIHYELLSGVLISHNKHFLLFVCQFLHYFIIHFLRVFIASINYEAVLRSF
jgi:hypothetical protein